MSEQRPAPTLGLRHLALKVTDLEACEGFYADLMGMQVEWRPDPDNVYLTTGHDNLALHRVSGAQAPRGPQSLDHLGFICRTAADVDAWYAFLVGHGVEAGDAPRTHRDGARSFYCRDPEGNTVQVIHHPPIVENM